MKRWLRRLLALLLLLVWLLVMLFPLGAVLLATQKQLAVGREQGRQLRLFLIQGQEQEGIGVEWRRPLAGPEGESGCFQTRLTYLMWVGEGENVSYCQCYAEDGSLRDTYPGACVPP